MIFINTSPSSNHNHNKNNKQNKEKLSTYQPNTITITTTLLVPIASNQQQPKEASYAIPRRIAKRNEKGPFFLLKQR